MLNSGVSQATLQLRQWLVLPQYKSGRRKNDKYKESLLNPAGEIPKGFMAVYVGRKKQRYVIPTRYLSMPEFQVLMEKAGEEFGYDQEGGLQLPCEDDQFHDILFKCLRLSKKKSKSLKI
ncbi:auxin-induced protein 15A [Mercurialis annua]|uniref:auxin-induced protein 15A n=1 Tax=Mercurialis annua TaxID=3986 RepID=UPI00215EE03A|nr:auxin-induced protein 15A [Mercurialis annua]